MNRFDDKVVLITGAASGIGRATAERLAQEGATLSLSDLNSDGLAETAATCGDLGSKVRTDLVNVADEDQVKDMVAGVAEEFGRIDAVVNVAGILQFKHTHETTVEEFERIISVNLTGTFIVCREAIPHLLESRGNIVNTASTSAISGHPWTVAYASSKGGVAALTQTIAVEYGKQGLRCNAVAPGSILTPIQNEFQLPEGADAKLVHRIMALDEQRGPEVVAGAIAFLASDDGRHVNGTVVKVDGGTLA
ncbi:MAG: SDR family NAD(P)-dependent oxidoreductase [Microthrixaceae bacterium]